VYGQHNLGYWEGRPYIGLGPSAHSYIFPYRWWNRPNLKFYVSQLGSVQGARQVEGELITPELATLEWFILHFRLSREIPWAVMPLPQKSFSQFRALAETWAERGWVRLSAEGMQLLPLGWLWLDTLLAEVFDLLTYAA
jgi:oxygen-independent coproporphyrinogen-3 oxidase